MGFWDGWDGGSVVSSSRSHRGHKSSKSSKSHRSRSHSRPRGHRHNSSSGGLGGFLGGGSHYSKHNRSSGSFFNLGNNSSRSLFGLGRSSSSYYKRSPRNSFVQRAYKKLRRLLRDLIYYAKRHPWKVFLLVIMPLITGGALTALLARFGLRLPPTIEKWLGVAARTAGGDSMGLVGEAVRMVSGGGAAAAAASRGSHYSRGHDGGVSWERSAQWDSHDRGRSSGGGWMDSISKFFD